MAAALLPCLGHTTGWLLPVVGAQLRLLLPCASGLVKRKTFLDALEERLEPPLKQVGGSRGACSAPTYEHNTAAQAGQATQACH